MWAVKYDPRWISRKDIPISIGIYAWFTKDTDELIYIGKATGKGGLRKRIWSQHLNPKYLESRKNKFTAKDSYQVNNPIYHNNQLVIDKSAFRKNVSRAFLLKAGVESVEYITNNFLFAFKAFNIDEVDTVVELEKQLIQEIKPRLNISYT
ncbi:GIY-YIG nuclease family protein [Paenibacillus phocaensis]|uniref:GIY-YIG nuclease family protein n=1 Tax=Paenibacillus phocaensis TaxID=1776378 RepID=UPI000839BF18|nr:hypothetical protein [Paenibacillus phocaensis]